MHTLPPLPTSIRSLRDSEREMLQSQHEGLQRRVEDCPVCLGTRRFRFYDDMALPLDRREVVDYECPCEDQFRLSRFLQLHGVGRQFAKLWWGDTTGATPTAQAFILEYVAQCEQYARNGLGLFLYGTSGSGKSMFAALVLKRFIALGLGGYWTTFDQMLDRYTATWRDREERAWFDRTIRNTYLLVIDDLGREGAGRKSTMAESAIDSMFRSRVQNGLTTILTSNLTPDQFRATYDSAVSSLVSESCLAHEFSGGSYRADAAANVLREIKLGISRPVTLG